MEPLIEYIKKIFIFLLLILSFRKIGLASTTSNSNNFIDLPDDHNFCPNSLSYFSMSSQLCLFAPPNSWNTQEIYQTALMISAQNFKKAVSQKKIQKPLEVIREQIREGANVDQVLEKKAMDYILQLSPEFFEFDTTFGIHTLKSGVKASAALDDLLNSSVNQASLECQSGALLFHYISLLNVLREAHGKHKGETIFNDFFGNGQANFPKSQLFSISEYGIIPDLHNKIQTNFLRFPTIPPLNFFLKTNVNCSGWNDCALSLGAKIYMKNHDDYLLKHYAGSYQGMAAIHIGNGKYWSLDMEELSTRETMEKTLVEKHNQAPDTLDIQLAKKAGVAKPANYKKKITSRDISTPIGELDQIDEEKIDLLIKDPSKCLAQFQEYLAKTNNEMTRKRDKSFLAGRLTLPLPKHKINMPTSIDLDEKKMKKLAKAMNYRFIKDKATNRSLIISPHYEIFLSYLPHTHSITTQYSPKLRTAMIQELDEALQQDFAFCMDTRFAKRPTL